LPARARKIKPTIVRMTTEQARKYRLSPADKARLDDLTDAEITAAAKADPDNPPLTAKEFATMRKIKRGPRCPPPPAPERRTHIALADLLRRVGRADWLWFHVPNGEYRTKETGALLLRMGVMPGVFDLLLISPTGAHHWLELKRGAKAGMSLAQIRFRHELQVRGVPYGVARSFDEAVDFLRAWGVIEGVKVQ
jgi:hypothetical protein